MIWHRMIRSIITFIIPSYTIVCGVTAPPGTRTSSWLDGWRQGARRSSTRATLDESREVVFCGLIIVFTIAVSSPDNRNWGFRVTLDESRETPIGQAYLVPTEPLLREGTAMYRKYSNMVLIMFGYMYGTCTLFFPTCSDQVQTNLL